MKEEMNRIAILFRETNDGNNWTGINVSQAFEGVDYLTAVKRINASHLNIAELAMHLLCWNKIITKRLRGENYIPAKEEDFLVIDLLTDHEWQLMKQQLNDSFDELISKLSAAEDDILDRPMFKGSTSAYRNIHGQISHLHYHLAQIVLLKKIFAN